MPIQVVENYIPEVTLYGDGRLIWTETAADGGRRVLAAQLSEAEVTAVLERVVNAGFFGWQASYGDFSVADLASQCLRVALAGQSHQVCVSTTAAPRPPSTRSTPFWPAAPAPSGPMWRRPAAMCGRTATRFAPPAEWAISQWPAEAAGFSLATAAGGQWAEGEALVVAWAAANAGPGANTVQDGDRYYQLTVQVPGLTENAPP